MRNQKMLSLNKKLSYRLQQR